MRTTNTEATQVARSVLAPSSWRRSLARVWRMCHRYLALMSELTRAAFSLTDSMARAETRLGKGGAARRKRSDRGGSRLVPKVEAKLRALLGAHDLPPILDVHRHVISWCKKARLAPPSRATLYNAIERVEPPTYETSKLPDSVRACLHNVGGEHVSGAHVVFAAFNYGDTRALGFAAGLPWACLHRAASIPGFRPKSLALLRSVMRYRGI
jgi:hypothetical protein